MAHHWRSGRHAIRDHATYQVAIGRWILVCGEVDALVSRSMQHAQLVTDNLGGMTLKAIFAHPFAGLQIAFNVDQRPFFQMLAGNLRQPFVQHYTVPFRRIAARASRLVFPSFASRDRKMRNLVTVLQGAKLRVLSKMADQHGLVERTSHIVKDTVVPSG